MPPPPPRQKTLEALRAGQALDLETRKFLLALLQAPRQCVGAERLALRTQGWSIARIARAAGRSHAAVKQSMRRERRRREEQNDA